jgi:hypothetical protein
LYTLFSVQYFYATCPLAGTTQYSPYSVETEVGKCDEFIAFLENVVDFFVKKIKVSMQLEPFISTERSFLKHFAQCDRSLVFKYERDLYFFIFPENKSFTNKMIDYAHHCVEAI